MPVFVNNLKQAEFGLFFVDYSLFFAFFFAAVVAFLTFLPYLPADAAVCLPALSWNFSTRRAVSTNFCLPV
jgi:hypothetical protein